MMLIQDIFVMEMVNLQTMNYLKIIFLLLKTVAKDLVNIMKEAVKSDIFINRIFF